MEKELDPKMDVEDKRNAQNFDSEEAVVAKTMDEEEEV